MSTAAKFIEQISAAGISIAAEGSALSFTPASRLTAEQREFIREHKTDILAELRAVRSSEAVLEPCQPGDDIPSANDEAAELTDTERGALIAMGMRWQYSAEDWNRLWSECQDPVQRAAWLRIAESEQPPAPDVDDPEQSITVRVEADIGTGRKVFDLRVPLDKWNEAAFAEQVSRLTDARWWRLDTPKRCTDCRHARPTSHPALVDCDQRDDPPSCGYWWSTDEKLCLEWAPSHTDTHGQTADNELRNAR